MYALYLPFTFMHLADSFIKSLKIDELKQFVPQPDNICSIQYKGLLES